MAIQNLNAPILLQHIIEELQHIVGTEQVKTNTADLEFYGRDWTRVHQPNPCAIVLPKTTQEVQALVQLANRQQLAIVPSGGRTGLSGGAVAMQGELVIALDRMNTITDFNPIDRTLTCGAGVITQQLQEFAKTQGLYYPIDLAAAGSSQIGGNISTNAGGIRVIRYGMTRDWITGLEVVTGQGNLLQLNQSLIKNNTGYDLKQLFVGAEGTLGIITAANIRLTTIPAQSCVLLLAANQLQDLMPILMRFRNDLHLLAFEFFSDLALQRVIQQSALTQPFNHKAAYYALIEFEKISDNSEDQALSAFEDCLNQGWIQDGLISQNEQQSAAFWRYREGISEALAQEYPYKYDLAVRPSQVPIFLQDIEALVHKNYPNFTLIWFGHIGDGNLHLNILKPTQLTINEFTQCCYSVSKAIFELIQHYRGAISAEHGIGLLKRDFLTYSRSAAEIALMKQIKRLFDPNGILNPGKIFTADQLQNSLPEGIS